MPKRRTTRQVYRVHWLAEAHDAMRVTIASGLKERLEAPKQLPSDIASLLGLVTGQSADRYPRG